MAKRTSAKKEKSLRAEPLARKKSRRSKPIQSAAAKSRQDQKTSQAGTSPKGIEVAEGLNSAQQAIREGIGRLTEQAEGGDLTALVKLLLTATFSTSGLHKVQISNPDALKPWLAEMALWPIVATNNDVANKSIIAALKELGFGSEASIGNASLYFARTPILASTIASLLFSFLEGCRAVGEQRHKIDAALKLAKGKRNKKAFDVLQESQLEMYRSTKSGFEAQFEQWKRPLSDEYFESRIEECSKLPQLSGESWKEWFALARKVFMHLTDGRPEDIPDLRKLGGLRFDPVDKKLKFFQGQEYRPSKERGIVRDNIVSHIRYAFKIKAVESGSKP